MKIINGLGNWIRKLFLEFTNIYDDHEMRDSRNSFVGESSSFSSDYLNKLRGADPVTGKRKISVRKILFRVLIVVLIVFFVFLLLRINTDVSFWGRGY